MDIYAIRKQNLIALIGTRRKNACAQKWEMSAAHLSQILSDKTEKNLGDDVARRIETMEGLDRGWLDQLRDVSSTPPVPATKLLTGKELGAAIESARLEKGLSKAEMAKIFSVTPPSVQGWITTGRIDKAKLFEMIRYFSDVLGPEHWGLNKEDGELLQLHEDPKLAAPQSAADIVRAMLETRAGKSISPEARERLLLAAEEAQPATNVITGDFNRAGRLASGDILIPQYDVRASMGHGQVPAEYVEFMRNVVVSGVQLEKLGLEYTSPANLSIITGWGQSMEGTINDRDPLIVDRGVTEFTGDGIYLLTWDGMLYIKRLQKADAEHFDMISDNPKHKDRVVPVEAVTIHARVLYIWRGMKA